MLNWSLQAGLQLYLGGRNPNELTELDNSYTNLKGFKVVGIFDNSSEIIGSKQNDVVVKDISELEEVVTREKVDIAILAIPARPAQEITDKLVACWIKGIWNFAPIDLKLPRNVVLENVHLDGSLLTLTYYMNSLKDYPGVR